MMDRRASVRGTMALIVCVVAGCDLPEPAPGVPTPSSRAPTPVRPTKPTSPTDLTEPTRPTPPLVAAARSQIGRTVLYDPSYVGLAYPGGDVPIDRGVCTDVVIRALRDAFDLDLQRLVHEDMKSAFASYPTIWGLKRPDRNIDHRRVPNLRRYFERQGYALAVRMDKGRFLPGDLVTCTVANRPHIMIASDR